MTEAPQTCRPVEGPLEPSVSPLIPARALTFEKPAAWRAPALSAFVKQHHYSKACPPGMHWFSAWHGAELVDLAPRKVEVVVCPPKNVYRYALRPNSAAERIAHAIERATGGAA